MSPTSYCSIIASYSGSSLQILTAIAECCFLGAVRSCVPSQLEVITSCSAQMDSKLAFLRKTLQENYQQLDATSYLECINKEASYTKADSMDVELVFRGFLEDITSQVGVTEVRFLTVLPIAKMISEHLAIGNSMTSICLSSNIFSLSITTDNEGKFLSSEIDIIRI